MMRKLIFFFIGILLLPIVQAQVVSSTVYFAPAVASEEPSGPPSFLTSDGYTEGWYIDDYENVTDDGGGIISQWDDMSAHANHLTKTGDYRPLWTEDGIDFDGVDDEIVNAGMDVAIPCLIYMVVRQNTYVETAALLRLDDSPGVRVEQSGGSGHLLLTTDGGTTYISVTGTLNSFAILRVLINSTASALQWNENTIVTGDAGANPVDYFHINQAYQTSDITVKEVIVRSVADDTEDQQLVVDYLKEHNNIIY